MTIIEGPLVEPQKKNQNSKPEKLDDETLCNILDAHEMTIRQVRAKADFLIDESNADRWRFVAIAEAINNILRHLGLPLIEHFLGLGPLLPDEEQSPTNPEK